MSEISEEDLIRATLRGLSRAIILWLVSQKPMSGYHITKEITRLTERRFTSGTIYPLLYELERKGFITGKWTEKGRRRIKYYSITEEGEEILGKIRRLLEKPLREILQNFLGGEA
ncbi:PadR family transcriptional regulator [Candidatus Bathyarchaeota archaeon]|nr:MAG: PadR family transcriptional regulator [Candidatus Bathyarchaeota archaeon ex4484_40]RJS79738.1 MAG: PadR family transcriptional regulator [Candidatus Bathyarchaeota archaeon]RLG98483.1 MAG: PadR family transcriptional regulator [Candidatus Bathyarchaeota archaeon]